MLFCNIIFVAVLCIDLERRESFQLPETTFKFFFFRLLPLSEEGFNGSHSSALVPSQPTGPLLGFENFIRNYGATLLLYLLNVLYVILAIFF